MLGMDDWYLYQEMKRIDNKVKVCFLTDSEMFFKKFRKEEQFDKDLFLRKPIRNEDLVEYIKSILQDQAQFMYYYNIRITYFSFQTDFTVCPEDFTDPPTQTPLLQNVAGLGFVYDQHVQAGQRRWKFTACGFSVISG